MSGIETKTEIRTGRPKSELIVVIILIILCVGIFISYNTKGTNLGTNLILLSIGGYAIYDLYCKHSTYEVQTVVIKDGSQ